MIEVLHQCGLVISNPSILRGIHILADRSMEEARRVAAGPHGLEYDNINLSTSTFVEQTSDMPSKVQSGTFAVIYELLNGNPQHMKIAPLIQRLKASSPLKVSAIRPSKISIASFTHQSCINSILILFKYVKGFDTQNTHPLLQHRPRHMLPQNHKTKFYPCRANTIDESSVLGNLQVHDNVYRVQLGMDSKDLNDLAIPTINDQLTNARIRGAQTLRAKDINAWERREIFQLSFGIFHLVMNFIWALLQTHRGSINNLGSLSQFFAILEKVRLGSDKPDYHTLLAALTQILEGLILNAWRIECGNLDAYASSNPSAEDILAKAHCILRNYATPSHKNEPVKKPQAGPAGHLNHQVQDDRDAVHENVVRLTRDLLYVAELIDAISSGDFGRIEDILPDLACMFRGAGSNNYSTEILHFLFNVKEVWTPEFA
jgi:hypothetical protein